MDSRFTHYLDGIVSPERVAVYVKACEALRRLGLRDHEFMIDQFMDTPSLDTPTVFLDQLDNLLLPSLVDYLAQMGVGVVDSITMATAADMLDAMLNIENYDDLDTLHALATTDESGEEALAEILAITGSLNAGEYLSCLETVSADAMKRIAAITVSDHLLDEVDATKAEISRERTQAFLAQHDIKVFKQALEDKILFGSFFEALYVPYIEMLETLTVEQSITELMAFALASSLESSDQIRQEIETAITLRFWPEPPASTKAVVCLAQLIKELPSAKA